MIELKELRIGNNIISGETRIITVSQFYNDHIWGEETRKGYPKEHFKGIPLTEEWLLKFGFELSSEVNTKSSWDFYSSIVEKYYSIDILDAVTIKVDYPKPDCIRYSYNYRWKDLQFVHELQNLYFALNDTELILKEPVINA